MNVRKTGSSSMNHKDLTMTSPSMMVGTGGTANVLSGWDPARYVNRGLQTDTKENPDVIMFFLIFYLFCSHVPGFGNVLSILGAKAQLKNQGVFPHQVATTEPGEEELIDFIQAIQAGGLCKMEITSNERSL